MEKIRVLLLDDHEMVRRGIVDVLDACDDIEVVCEAATVAEARARLDAARPDVAVLDVRLPDGSGIELCRDMRASSDIGVVMLTSFDDDEALFAAIMAGAAAFVLKDVRGHDLVDIVRRVHLGQSRLDPAVTGRVLARIRDGQRGDPRLEGLSQQERTVLHLISEGLTNRQIAERMNLAEKTVKNYVSSLLRIHVRHHDRIHVRNGPWNGPWNRLWNLSDPRTLGSACADRTSGVESRASWSWCSSPETG